MEMALLIVDDSCVNWLESSNLLFVYEPISLGILSRKGYEIGSWLLLATMSLSRILSEINGDFSRKSHFSTPYI